MKALKKRILATFMTTVMVVACTFTATGISSKSSKAESNSPDSAYELTIDEDAQTYHFDKFDVQYFKFTIPSDANDQTVYIKLSQEDIRKNAGRLEFSVYDETLSDLIMEVSKPRPLQDDADASVLTGVVRIQSELSDLAPTLIKGNTYYVKLQATFGYNSSHGDYSLEAFSVPDKTVKPFSIKAKKGKKTFSIKTIEESKIQISSNKRILINNSAKTKKIKTETEKDGKITVNLSRKLKKGDKITVTVRKLGYKSKTKTIKIK